MGKPTRAARRTSGLPPRGTGMGDWYELKRPHSGACMHCGRRGTVEVQVLEYLPALDPDGDQARQHPGWRRMGWLCWHACTACDGDFVFPASEQVVAILGKTLGGWKDSDAS